MAQLEAQEVRIAMAMNGGVSLAVWIGGVITLCVVAVTAWRAPRLLQLDLAELERAGAAAEAAEA